MQFTYITQPWEHQIKALEYLYPRNTAALYTDMGTGKTKIMIDLVRNRGFSRTLVVAPKKACDVWEYEIGVHGGDTFKVINVAGLGWQKALKKLQTNIQWKKMDKNPTHQIVILVNYESVWRDHLEDYFCSKNLGLDTVICDESHRIKSPSSKVSKYLTKLGKRVPNRYLVTGTPLAEKPEDIYAQYRFLDPSIFGTNFRTFCERYQNLDVVATARLGFPVLNKKEPYKNLDELHKKMFSCAFMVESSVKLPKTIDIQYRRPLDKDALALYKELRADGALELNKGVLSVENAISMITREQQLLSGYVKVEKDDDTVKYIRVSSSRRESFRDLLEEFSDDEPIVVFAKYKKELKDIAKTCRELGIPCSELSGRKDTLDDWQSGKTRVVAIQYTSGAESITLTRARYCVYYSLTHSLALYQQSRKRIHRPGQKRTCFYYHLVLTGGKTKTVDEEIFEALTNKMSVVEYVMKRRISHG